MTKAQILKKEILSQYRSVRQFALEMQIPYSTLVTALEAQSIEKAGYATGGKYAENLQKIIEQNGLQKYDRSRCRDSASNSWSLSNRVRAAT